MAGALPPEYCADSAPVALRLQAVESRQAAHVRKA